MFMKTVKDQHLRRGRSDHQSTKSFIIQDAGGRHYRSFQISAIMYKKTRKMLKTFKNHPYILYKLFKQFQAFLSHFSRQPCLNSGIVQHFSKPSSAH